MASVHITKQGKRDIDSIWSFIAEDRLSAADRVVDEIVARCELLVKQPLSGAACHAIAPDLPNDLRFALVRNYVIFYRPLAEGIVVYRVLHGAIDFPTRFREEPIDPTTDH